MRGAGDGIFIDVKVGIEAARDDVGFAIRACGGDDNAARVFFAGERGDLLQIRAKCADGGLVFQFDQIVEPVAADPERLRAEHGGEAFRRCGWGDGLGGEIQLDPWSAIDNKPIRGEQAAAGVEARLLAGGERAGLPQDNGRWRAWRGRRDRLRRRA